MISRKRLICIALLTGVIIVLGSAVCLNNSPTPDDLKRKEIEQPVKAEDIHIAETVEEKITAIIEKGPRQSSNPYDYIKGSQDFNDLTVLGKPALNYMFEQFQKNNGAGLREYIMASACAKIMGVFNEDAGIGTSNGREWFYKYQTLIDDEKFTYVDADADVFQENPGKDEIVLPEKTDKTNPEDVLSKYILARNRSAYSKGEKAIEAHYIYQNEEKNGVVTLCMLVKFGWFGFENDTFTPISGSGGIPTRVKLKKSTSGEYEVVEYREAMDGGMWAESIREMFPEDTAELVLQNNDEINEMLWSKQVEDANRYLASLGRSEAEVEGRVSKDRGSKEMRHAIYLVSIMNPDFPDWNGTREVLVRTGGPAPGAKVRCVLETKTEEIEENDFSIILTKTWQIKINGRQPVSCWKYRVTGENVQLVEKEDNDRMIRTIK